MILLFFTLGLVIGSFLNVVIYRLPLALEGKDYSIIKPVYSFCPNCKARLRALQLIPVFSFLVQRGKCKYCQQKIAWQYPFIELFCGFITALIFLQFGYTYKLFFYLTFIYIAVALFYIDFKYKLLPDVLTISLLYLGLLFHINNPIELSSSVIGAISGYLSLWSIYWIFKIYSGKEGLGYGDFKLTAALGAWLGWQTLPILLGISAILALVFAYLKKIPKAQPFAFGTFLLISGLGLLLYEYL